MTTSDDPRTWTGAFVRNPHGDQLGRVEGVYFHDATGRATWAAVTDGAGSALVPLDHAAFDDGGLCVPYRVDQLATAPRPASGRHLDPELEQQLYRHYGVGPVDPSQAAPPNGRDDRAPGEMVLSREELRTGVERRVYARYRLVTYVVTEDMTFTVPVSRQEVRLEPVPLDGTEDAAAAWGELVEDVHEVVLHREEVRFTTTVVPAERVRLVRRVVRGEQQVSAQLRSEQIDIDRTSAPADSAQYPMEKS